MRIATLKDHSPDGRLVIVEPDGKTCRPAKARTLQQALDAGGLEPEGDLVAFHEHLCHSPLPRAFHFLDGSAYVNHVELVRKARGATMPESFWTDPLMYQGGSDSFLGPHDPIVGDPDWGMDFEAEVAVITGAVPMGASRDVAAAAIRLVMLC
ncbi:MAG: fumarylacetoacetate hydrolase family protein, partial [Paracoccaceae bacterium]